MRPGKGGIQLGGIYRYNETEYIRSLFPHNITEVTGHRVSNQIYEGLMDMDPATLSPRPSIAQHYIIDSSGLVYTFYLHKGVRFHDNDCFPNKKGREVTAHDFKWCFDLLCTKSDMNKGFWVFENRVKGATTYHNLSVAGKPLPSTGVEGIKVIDDYTIEITLEQPFAAFIHIMATPFTFVFPKEAYNKYGKDMRIAACGTGPFFLKKLIEDEAVILSRNPHYWRIDSFGNVLPYLDGIRVSFIKESQAELLELKKGNLDQVFRPALEMIDEMLNEDGSLSQEYNKFIHQSHPSLSLQYYGFLNINGLFTNKKLRQAFCYAIDRDKICKYTLKGTGMPAKYGVVPPGMSGYNNENIIGYKYDIVKAKQLIADAGYPEGRGLPEITLQINSGGGRNQQVAEAITKMLRDNLNLNIKISQLQWAQHLENAETGKCQFWRFGWVADYPDPENFLNLFYSIHIPQKLSDNSYINTTRYSNPAYDEIFKKALATVDDRERLAFYEMADNIVIKDAPILPIYYDMDHRLLQGYVRNYPQNAMEYRLFREVWLDIK